MILFYYFILFSALFFKVGLVYFNIFFLEIWTKKFQESILPLKQRARKRFFSNKTSVENDMTSNLIAALKGILAILYNNTITYLEILKNNTDKWGGTSTWDTLYIIYSCLYQKAPSKSQSEQTFNMFFLMIHRLDCEVDEIFFYR